MCSTKLYFQNAIIFVASFDKSDSLEEQIFLSLDCHLSRDSIVSFGAPSKIDLKISYFHFLSFLYLLSIFWFPIEQEAIFKISFLLAFITGKKSLH